ncbi:Uncharacterised protein [Enterobacter hormaechei]|uniref:hypothetical protein n=1 Tax=Enterobacter hormaechei TaxID=158836 RepID=UPI000799DCCA|nr:hypothetical protein [Enterobacter hormaechei]CZW01223.1 Uncharacterised protein [Enterobacter hormaechei]
MADTYLPPGFKKCKSCQQVKPFEQFGKELKGKFGLKSKCRACISEKSFRDGRWIIVQEFGNDYSCFEGVLKNGDDLNTEPKFYSDLESVAVAAFGMMKQIYPQYQDSTLEEFLAG